MHNPCKIATKTESKTPSHAHLGPTLPDLSNRHVQKKRTRKQRGERQEPGGISRGERRSNSTSAAIKETLPLREPGSN